jgi:serine/threonine protein kinase
MAKVFTIAKGLENMGALRTGGQGSVYKGKRIGPIISAVKLMPTPIHTEDKNDKNFRDFQNEVAKLKKVNEEPNPNVVKILSSGLTESGSFPFIEMEYIEGPDLEELLKEPHDPIFGVREAIKVADQLACALAHCHKVNVKHGDIKSNNVKFNLDTGNYMLLDFGLAVMSDEQRRTSLRHAGAIEFMAPEQHDGEMLFESDVYSYGIILYELLAGTVPFPLTNKSETSRNTVMVAHMEEPVPDILKLRKLHLPENWPREKMKREMQIPQWLLDVIAKCLQKDPKNRYSNGVELHEAIMQSSLLSVQSKDEVAESISLLQSENERLRSLVLQQQEESVNTAKSPAVHDDSVMSISRLLFTLMLVLIAGLSIATGYLLFAHNSGRSSQSKTDSLAADSAKNALKDTVKPIPVQRFKSKAPVDSVKVDSVQQPESRDTVKKEPLKQPDKQQDTTSKGLSAAPAE